MRGKILIVRWRMFSPIHECAMANFELLEKLSPIERASAVYLLNDIVLCCKIKRYSSRTLSFDSLALV